MEIIILSIVGIAIIYQGAKLLVEQSRLKKKMKNMENEMINRSIDYSGDVGSGISLTRKNYPSMEDDFRYKVEPSTDEVNVKDFKHVKEPTRAELRDNVDRKSRHNINPANRPSLIQEKYGKEDS